MNACADGNPERNENASEADQAKGNATRFPANLPNSRYEGVDSEKLVGCMSAGAHTQDITSTVGEEAYEGDQGDSEFTNLFDNPLCCAKGPCRDNSVMSPPDTEGTANPLQYVENEKRELSWNFNEPSKSQQKKLSGRPYRYRQATETTSNYRLGTSSYTNVRSTVKHLVKQDKHVNGSWTYTSPD